MIMVANFTGFFVVVIVVGCAVEPVGSHFPD